MSFGQNVNIKFLYLFYYLIQDSFGIQIQEDEKINTDIQEQIKYIRKFNKFSPNLESEIIPDLIEIKIKSNLYNLIKICENKLSQNTEKLLFTKIYNNNYMLSPEEKLKSGIIMSKINNSLKLFIETYSYYHKNRLIDTLTKWNFISQTIKSIENLEPKIAEKFNKKLNEKTKEINNQIKTKENANNALKKKINELNETIAKYKKTLKSNEEKEELLNKNIKTLERDNSKLEQEIKNNESLYDSGIDNKKEQLENKIQELETNLKNLEEDLRDQEQYLTNYSKEMNEMLGYFEKKLEEKEASKNINDNEINQKHSKFLNF